MNRRTAGYLFKDLTECNHFQAQHGGVVHRIQKIEDRCIIYDKSPLGLDDGTEVNEVTEIPVNNVSVNVCPVINEWDVNELCDLFEAKRRVMIRAVFAGSGKSFACKAMENRGHKVLFVCPTNKLVQNNRESGVTLNQFFGVGMSEDGGVTRMSKFDDKPYDVIVFDEIYFASVRMLAKIKRYSELNPDKIILATGDTDQLESIDLISDHLDYDTYMNHCVDTIFPNNVLLKENKRLKSNKDKTTLAMIKRDLFDEDIPINDTLRKYFHSTKLIRTETNIAFKNSTCELVAKAVRKILLKKTADYNAGEKIVCRKYLKLKNLKFNVNFEYTIDTITGSNFTIIDESTDQAFTLPKDLIQKNFIHSYCRTCHSFQGSSVNEAITIFDTDFYFVTRKWVYTAVTRATDLSRVFVYVGPGFTVKEQNEDDVLERYLELKVHNYKSQDLKAGRALPPSGYVTKQWLFDQYGKTCPGCGDCFRFELFKGRVDGNLTADRIDCEESHHLNNIAPLCTTCNQRKSCWE